MRSPFPGFLALLATGMLHAPAKAVAQAPSPTPAFGATVDAVADLGARAITHPLADSARLAVRGVELAVHGAVGSWSVSATGTIAERGATRLLEAWLSRSIGSPLRLTIGRAPVAGPLGGTAHLHDLATVERPGAQRLLVGLPDGIIGTGASARVQQRLGPLTLWVDGSVVDRFREDSAGLVPVERPNRLPGGMGVVARASAQMLAGPVRAGMLAFAATSRRLHPLSASVVYQGERINAVPARQTLVGAAFAMRSHAVRGDSVVGVAPTIAPLDGWMLAADPARWAFSVEAMQQRNEARERVLGRIPGDPQAGGPFYRGPMRDFMGLGARLRARPWRALDAVLFADAVEHPAADGARERGGGVVLGHPLAANGRIAAALSRHDGTAMSAGWRVLLQGVVTLGTHAVGTHALAR